MSFWKVNLAVCCAIQFGFHLQAKMNSIHRHLPTTFKFVSPLFSDETDPVVLTDENGSQSSLGGIEADSLGENSQVTFTTNAVKEAVLHELDDSGPVFEHDAKLPEKVKEITNNNDMSQYDTEEINLVENNEHKSPKAKPVRLPSLTEEGSKLL